MSSFSKYLKQQQPYDFNTLDEMMGTLQLNGAESHLIDRIQKDLEQGKYKQSRLSKQEYADIPELSNANAVWSMEYENPLQWMRNLQIIVADDSDSSSDIGAALINNGEKTVFAADAVLYACIVINKNVPIEYSKRCVAHELNHYYSELKRFQTTGNAASYADLDICGSVKFDNVDFREITQEDLDAGIGNIRFLNAVYMSSLYWLNQSEIRAHIEDIFYEMKHNFNPSLTPERMSETLETYVAIKNVLEYIRARIDSHTKAVFEKLLDRRLRTMFNTGRKTNLSRVDGKLRSKLKKVFKHVNRLHKYLSAEYAGREL